MVPCLRTCTLYWLLCAFPVTACTCERCSSALKRLKTRLRSTMENERLSGLTMMSMYRDEKFDLEAVIDIFAGMHDRKVDFTHRGHTPTPDMY